jgi:hypothetical protein
MVKGFQQVMLTWLAAQIISGEKGIKSWHVYDAKYTFLEL